MTSAFLRWIIVCIAVFAAAHLPFLGITYESWVDLLVAALILSIVNAFVRPIIMIITLPFILVSFGLFIWVINAFLLYFVSWVMGSGFTVPSFLSALGGSLVISLISFFLGSSTREHTRRVIVRSEGSSSGNRKPPPGQGPIIDI